MNKEQKIKEVKLAMVYTSKQIAQYDSNLYEGNVTKIFFNTDETILTLVCLRPGLVIGKGGKDFDLLKNNIESQIGKIELLIEEDNFWQNLYS